MKWLEDNVIFLDYEIKTQPWKIRREAESREREFSVSQERHKERAGACQGGAHM